MMDFGLLTWDTGFCEFSNILLHRFPDETFADQVSRSSYSRVRKRVYSIESVFPEVVWCNDSGDGQRGVKQQRTVGVWYGMFFEAKRCCVRAAKLKYFRVMKLLPARSSRSLPWNLLKRAFTSVGRRRRSVTTLSVPFIRWISVVNYEMNWSWRRSRPGASLRGEEMAWVSGAWFV